MKIELKQNDAVTINNKECIPFENNNIIILFGYTLKNPEIIYSKYGSLVIADGYFPNKEKSVHKKWKITMEEIIDDNKT